MFYQVMLCQKKRGGLKVLRENYKDWFDDTTTLQPPEPDKPIGRLCIAQYKTVMKWIYKDQVAGRVCSITWGQIWTLTLESLPDLIKIFHPSIDKRNYVQ
jgi:hypothetical protein